MMTAPHGRHLPAEDRRDARCLKRAPVSFEVWVVYHWLDMGWDIDYTIEQSLKWHQHIQREVVADSEEWGRTSTGGSNGWATSYGLRFFDYPTKAAACDTRKVGFGWRTVCCAVLPEVPVALARGEHASYTFDRVISANGCPATRSGTVRSRCRTPCPDTTGFCSPSPT